MKDTVQFEEIRCKTALNPVKAPSMPFDWSINPYRGCQHGCSFCYARSTHTFLGRNADDTFQKHIFLKKNAPEMLETQLSKMSKSRKGLTVGPIAIGTATDPYQPAEARNRLTRQCLEILVRYPVPLTITTRSPLILRDLDLLKQIPDITVNISINTLNLSVWRNMEPFSPSPVKRLETVKRLNREGIRAGIFLAPILPYLTDNLQEIAELIGRASRCKAKFVMPSILRLSTQEVRSWFFLTLQRHYPRLTGKFGFLYRSSTYPHADYSRPLMEAIEGILARHDLAGKEPLSDRTVTKEAPGSKDNGPIQLSFSF
ncbi:radical SAM protein [Paenibacillaceae bacterium T2]|uniref:Radical SAM protein n=1 Tax=Ferviditalea candida TaxID=3108399 RepID=A0ABU5ZEC8_9BACL|nr:radical SAM protein [Paenibacillaceae bacterium T2]